MPPYTNFLISPSQLIVKPYWPTLHAIILKAYEPTREDWPLPKDYERLDKDISKAGAQLCAELGPDCIVAVAFDNLSPIACATIQRFKTIRQIDIDGTAREKEVGGKEEKRGPEEWEINLVTTAAGYRSKGVAGQLLEKLEEYIVQKKGKVRLLVRTIDEISGPYWRNRGFKAVDEYCIVLPKGFSHMPDASEDMKLQREVLIWTGERLIN